MSGERLELLAPALELEDAYLSLLAEDPDAAGAGWFEQVGRDYAVLVRALDEEAHGVNLRPERVPQSVFWLVRMGAGDESGGDGKGIAGEKKVIVGVSRLRHVLNAKLEDVGGHIGYDVRPSERRKGYGARLLALTLERARSLGLPRVLLTCDTDNVASARIIEKNGGVLASQSVSPATGVMVSRYWIELT